MDTVLTLKDLGLILLGIAVIVLIVYLIVLAKNAIAVLKKTSNILDDVNEISTIASNRSVQVDELLDSALVKVAFLLSSLVNTVKKQKEDENQEIQEE